MFSNEAPYLCFSAAVGVILVTSDEHIVVLKRAGWTAECSGMYDRPGGHPEPSELEVLTRYLKKENVSSEEINDAVRNEVGTPSCIKL